MKSTTCVLSLAAVTALGVGSTFTRNADAAASTNLPNIVDTAIAAGNFTNLVAALQISGLDAPLNSNAGRFTVFAPTDAAFAAIPPQDLADLLADVPTLTQVLTYHVVDGGLFAADVLQNTTLTTLNGQRVDIDANGPSVDQAMITTTDILCGNGIIHVIDAVLFPNTENLLGTVASTADLSTLATAASQVPNVVGNLSGPAEFTVFAPVNSAFAALPQDRLNALLQGPNANLKSVLNVHIVRRSLYAEDVLSQTQLTSVEGKVLPIQIIGNDAFIDGARIIQTDIETTNGIVHLIDSVLLP